MKRRLILAAAGAATLPRIAGAQMDMNGLISAATAEGELNIMACPPDWANYGAIANAFSEKYGIIVTNENPHASSQQEFDAVIKPLGSDKILDSVDESSYIIGLLGKQDIFVPYQLSNWASIPPSLKDPHGTWASDYFGAIAFGTNTNMVATPPKGWDDLKNPAYKGMISLTDSPLTTGVGLGAVFAAALGNGGSFDDIEPGIDFFAELARLGNLNPKWAGGSAMLISGEAPILITWDFLLFRFQKVSKNRVGITVTLPEDAPAYGGYYCQMIPANAAHPNAARLWKEYLFSDEAQLLRLSSYAHPARYANLLATGQVPAALLAALPQADRYVNIAFPSLAQIAKAHKTVTQLWPKRIKLA